jgi:CRP-like cAMP-binding protein
VQALESVLSSLSFLAELRQDVIGRVAQRVATAALGEGESRVFEATMETARLVVVVSGEAELVVESPAGAAASAMGSGDRYGEMALLTGHLRRFTLTATERALVATLSKTGLEAILNEFPAVALPLAAELARELRRKNDIVRQALELHAEGLPKAELEAAIEERRREVARRGAGVTRLTPRAIFKRLVVEQGAEPPFWMLVGFLASLAGARLTVAFILKYGLEKRLFALVPGSDPNPMHVHHFNYGLVLIGAAGLAALFPFGRRALRLLALVFGLGCGLVFDEFALFWNLNPEYAQSLSLIAAAMAAVVLFQMTYFRRFWAAMAQRWVRSVRGAR